MLRENDDDRAEILSSQENPRNILRRTRTLTKSLARKITRPSSTSAIINTTAGSSSSLRRKLVCVGDGSIGKTSLLTFFSTGEFPKDYVPTIFDNYVTTSKVDDKLVELALWDTAGQDEYNRLRPLSYPDADCIILCFAIDQKDSFDNIETKWLPEINHHAPYCPLILIGLKADLRDNFTRKSKCLSENYVRGLSNKIPNCIQYLECSALSGVGVREAIHCATRVALLPKTRNHNSSHFQSKCVIQ